MTGRIVGIAIKDQHKSPLREVEEARVTEKGLEGNVVQSAHRRITLIAREDWEAVRGELGMDLPWHTRRANILVEGLSMESLLNRRLRVGEAEIQVNGETEPCGQIEGYYPGLRQALKPGCRGGIYGSVEGTGTIRIGDTVTVV